MYDSHSLLSIGICQCSSTYYYTGSVSLGNGYCVPLLLNNQACVNTTQCDYRVGLVCANNVCACPPGKAHDPTITSIGFCVPAVSYNQNCSNSSLCSSADNLYCDYTATGNLSYGVCACNVSWSFWEGSVCRSQLSIGANCLDNTHCSVADGLICSTYPQSVGTCDCPQDRYWNNGCILKQWYNTSCLSSYVCDDYRGLTCQGLGTAMFQRCDCTHTNLMWDSVYRNRTFSCVPKKSFYQACDGDLECQETNYLSCKNGTCNCNYTDYWDGRLCQVKRTFADPCSSTYECKDYAPIYLTCQVVLPGYWITECLCPTHLYWDHCLQRCVFSKQVQSSLSFFVTSEKAQTNGNHCCLLDVRRVFARIELFSLRMRSSGELRMREQSQCTKHWMVVSISRRLSSADIYSGKQWIKSI